MKPDPRYLMEVMKQVWKEPSGVIQRVVDQQWTFAVRHCPSAHDSDEEPPIRLADHPEVIRIDGVLGSYNPDTLEIIIFQRGIHRVAALLEVSLQDLTFIVRLHEWAHALLHIGLREEERLHVNQHEDKWPEVLAAATHWYQTLDADLNERLAQLLTCHSLRSLNDEARLPAAQVAICQIAETFEVLTQRAPAEYQIDKFTRVSKARVVESIRLLKEGGLRDRAWETVITW